MMIKVLTLSSAAVLGLSVSLSYAGPCSDEIDRVQARVDAKLDAMAGAGPAAIESPAALLHHQPTPGSIAAAEIGLGDVSASKVAAAKAAMMRAREANREGDRSACEAALADVLRLIGQ